MATGAVGMRVEWTGRPTMCNGVDEATPARRLSRATLGLGVFKMAANPLPLPSPTMNKVRRPIS